MGYTNGKLPELWDTQNGKLPELWDIQNEKYMNYEIYKFMENYLIYGIYQMENYLNYGIYNWKIT